METGTKNWKDMTDFEKFVKNRGFEFSTEESIRAAYDRYQKCIHKIVISQDEFIAEATCRIERDIEILKNVYAALLNLVNEKKLEPNAIYVYARYGWCLKDPSALVSYELEKNKWMVNNCDTAITEEAAKVAVNREWGFEASRIEIIGTPYYEATDWQFIRFNCMRMTWLWSKDSLYLVYDQIFL